MKWNELTRECLSMDIGVIGKNLSMIGDFRAEQGLSEAEMLRGFRKPTYTPEAEFHAIQCGSCLQRIQRFIVIADKTFDPKAKNADIPALLEQAFKGTVVDAANCMTGVLALVREMSGQTMTSTEDVGEYLAKRFPKAEDDFSVFKSAVIDTLALLGAIVIQQRGRLRFYSSDAFSFGIENTNGDNLFLEPREMCSRTGVVSAIPYLFILLLHVAKCLDLATKYYLLANSDFETYAKAAQWFATPDEFEKHSNDKMPDAIAAAFEKYSVDVKWFADLTNSR